MSSLRYTRFTSKERLQTRLQNAKKHLRYKYGSFEVMPFLHWNFEPTVRAYDINWNSWSSRNRFGKIWHRIMTEMYELEVLQYERHLITMMTEWESSEEEDDDSSVSSYDDRQITPEPPAQIESSRVLLNYKNETIAVSNELYRKFNAYMISPQLYPYIGQEKKKFLEKQFKHQAGDDLMDIDVDYGKEFSNYWKKRVLVLRKETLDREKQKLMDKYKAVIPDCILEAQEKDSDVEIVEDVVVVSSDDEP